MGIKPADRLTRLPVCFGFHVIEGFGEPVVTSGLTILAEGLGSLTTQLTPLAKAVVYIPNGVVCLDVQLRPVLIGIQQRTSRQEAYVDFRVALLEEAEAAFSRRDGAALRRAQGVDVADVTST